MRLPTRAAKIVDLISFGFFTWVSVSVDEDTAGMEKDAKAADQNLRKKIGARNKAADALIEARAKRGVPRRKLAGWLKQLELEAKAAFGGNTKVIAYTRLFPKTASKILLLPAKTRYSVIAGVVTALEHAETPEKLKAGAHATGVKLLGQLGVADTEVATALAAFKAAVLEVKGARIAWFDAIKGLHGALINKFKTDRAQIDSYFPETAKTTGESDEAEPTPDKEPPTEPK